MAAPELQHHWIQQPLHHRCSNGLASHIDISLVAHLQPKMLQVLEMLEMLKRIPTLRMLETQWKPRTSSSRGLHWNFEQAEMVEEVFHRHAKTNAHPASLSPQERGHLGHLCCLSTTVHNKFWSKGLHKLLVGVDSSITGDSWDKCDLRQSDYSNTILFILKQQTDTVVRLTSLEKRNVCQSLAKNMSASGCFARLCARDELPHFSNPARTCCLWSQSFHAHQLTFADQTLQPMLDELQSLAESDSNAPSPGEIRGICLYAFAGSRTPKPASHTKHAGSIPCFNKVMTWSTRIFSRNHWKHFAGVTGHSFSWPFSLVTDII